MRSSRTEKLLIGLLFVLSQITLAVAGAFAALFVFVLIADGILEGSTKVFDHQILAFFQRENPDWFNHVIWFFTFLGNGTTIAVLAAIGFLYSCWRKRLWPDGVTFLLASLGGWVVLEVLKRVFQRTRPENLIEVGSYSFPSGHSFMAVAVYGFIAYRLTREAPRGREALVWFLSLSAIALIACSRMILGVHYPTDVLAGIAGGTAWLWACLAIPKLVERESWQNRMAALLDRAKDLPDGGSKRKRIRALLHGLSEEKSLGGVASWVLILYAKTELWLAQRNRVRGNTDRAA